MILVSGLLLVLHLLAGVVALQKARIETGQMVVAGVVGVHLVEIPAPALPVQAEQELPHKEIMVGQGSLGMDGVMVVGEVVPEVLALALVVIPVVLVERVHLLLFLGHLWGMLAVAVAVEIVMVVLAQVVVLGGKDRLVVVVVLALPVRLTPVVAVVGERGGNRAVLADLVL